MPPIPTKGKANFRSVKLRFSLCVRGKYQGYDASKLCQWRYHRNELQFVLSTHSFRVKSH